MNRLVDEPFAADDKGAGSGAEPVTVNWAINDQQTAVRISGRERLSGVLREQCGLTGTKIGCHAGDCGACTVLLDGEQVCSCMVGASQVTGQTIRTVEGLAALTDDAGRPIGRRLQQAFAAFGAAQCGICTPGMLMAAADLLLHCGQPDRRQINDALGGVLCRCTGYQKIIDAVHWAAGDDTLEAAIDIDPPPGCAVGARIVRLDAAEKVDGSARFGADFAPDDCLDLRVIRSPHPHATFCLGDLDAIVTANPGVIGYLVAADIPNNAFAIFADMRDQPALADGVVRFRGEAVLALVGQSAALAAIEEDTLPITYQTLPALQTIEQATANDAVPVQHRYPDNILCSGFVRSADLAVGDEASHRLSARMQTAHVEHAYIEPEAGYALWHGAGGDHDVTIFVTTQTPYLDRDEIAWMFELQPERVRIIPSVIGGGFGGKLDLSVQPLLVAAARKFDRPVRTVFERPDSMRSSTKRHPAQMNATMAADGNGRFVSYDFSGDFNTGPYASWGPTVANRVPIHASGPYRFDAVRARTRAVLTHDAVCGAFRGFGVPQSTLLNETLIDDLAVQLKLDPLELRFQNALQAGDQTPCGQTLAASVGLRQCLQVLRPAWQRALQSVAQFNADASDANYGWAAPDLGRIPTSQTDPHFIEPSRKRRGVGVACMWYGIGNTVIANPSQMKVGLRANGRFVLYNGAVDIGQGTYTVMAQICADALGVSVSLIDQVFADTSLTADAGKSSASRQTFVSGNAARLAGEQCRRQLLQILGVGSDAQLQMADGQLIADDNAKRKIMTLAEMAPDENGDLVIGIGHFNPPTVALDENGQGVPYATYGFAAQFAEVEVDLDLGTVRVLNIHAAHDVGRAINPTQVEGQIHGGIAQGLGLALMEDYRSGRTDNLHDYLIPTCGDMPAITTYLVEDGEPLGPYGAKGVGEPALVATAPAILNAIRHACGARLYQVPVTPDRLLVAIRATTT